MRESGGQRELCETSLGYSRNVIESGTWPLALLDQVLPECLRTKEIQTSTSDLELNASKGSATTSGQNDAGDGSYRVLVSVADIPAHKFVDQNFERDRL
jgi:hypothetical protein